MGYPHAAAAPSATRRSARPSARFYREFKGKRASFRDFQRVAEAVSGQAARLDLRRPHHARRARRCCEVKAGPVERPAGRRAVRRRRRAAADAGGRAVRRSTCRSSCRPSAASRRRPSASTSAEQPFSITADGRAAGALRRSALRRVPPPRPARDAAVDRPDLRRAARSSPCCRPSGAGGRARRRIASCSKGWQSDSAPDRRSSSTPSVAEPAGRPRRVDRRAARTGWRRRSSARGPATDASTPRGVEIDGEKMPLAGHTLVAALPPPGQRREGRSAGSSPIRWRRCPASAASSRTTGSTRTSASRATSRSTSSRASGSSPTRRCASTCGRTGQRAAQARRRCPPDARKALAELPPVFSQQALRDHVRVPRVARAEGPRARQRRASTRRRSTSPIGSRPYGLHARRRRRHVLPALHGRRRARTASRTTWPT